MTTIDTLAEVVRHKHGMSTEGAETALRTYIRQVEAEDGRTIDEGNIDDETGDFLVEAVAHAVRAGDMGQRELTALEEHVQRMAALDSERDRRILNARAAGARVVDIMAATRLSRSRVHQILTKE